MIQSTPTLQQTRAATNAANIGNAHDRVTQFDATGLR